jgi:thiol peroxidase
MDTSSCHDGSSHLWRKQMADVRNGAVTLKGNGVDLAGPELKVGDAAPEFKLQNNALGDVTLADSAGKKRIIITVPSLDTPTCHQETKRFNDEAGSLDGVEVLVVSMDLPFAQKRWCGAESAENIQALSGHRCTGFGEAYGVLIQGGPLHRCLARAVFVADGDGKLTHVEYVSEIADHPNYEAALAAVQ